MILGFKQFFDVKKAEPTYFREKILAGAYHPQPGWFDPLTIHNPQSGKEYTDKQFSAGFKPKLHTLRADPHDRWKAGRKIEMVYRGAGYKILDHFNKGIPELEKCVSTQKIEITWFTYHMKGWAIMGTKDSTTRVPVVSIDGERKFEAYSRKMIELAQNDGFDSIEQFYRWFNKDFRGKIIHFSDLRY